MPIALPMAAHAALAGFTFVEVLVVVGLLAVLATTVGTLLTGPGDGVALQSGQATLAALCSAARSRAVAGGGETRLIVSADPADPAGWLRFLQVVRADPGGPDRWLAEGSGFTLPPGVYVVPPTADAVPGDPAWPEARCSTALSSPGETMTINGIVTGPWYVVAYTTRGTTRGGSLVVASGCVTPEAAGPRLVFVHPDQVRAVRLRPSGGLTLLDEPGDLDP